MFTWGPIKRAIEVQPPSGTALSLLNFDAYPLVDNVDNTRTIDSTISSTDMFASPKVGSSGGALLCAPGYNGYQALSRLATWEPDTYVMTDNAITAEMFVRRDGAATLVGGSNGWEISAGFWVSYADYSADIIVTFGVYNRPQTPVNGVAESWVIVDSDNIYTAGVQTVKYDIPNSAYMHLACVIDGGTMTVRIYAAGVKILDRPLSGTYPVGDLRFGSFGIQFYTYSGESALKYADSARLSEGALYDADFTPPTAPFVYP